MTVRRISPILLPKTTLIQPINEALPYLTEVNPYELLVDEDYQRNLSAKSLKLIARIAAEWSWSKFKTPNVAKTERGAYLVTDGQHTAIAAVTRGDIPLLPVLVSENLTVAQQAHAFVGINRDRLGITPAQLFKAEVASGDQVSLGLLTTLEAAGITVLAQPKGDYEVGDTMAVSSFKVMYNRLTTTQFNLVLETCVNARLAPISAAFVKAINELLWPKSKRDIDISPRVLAALIRSKSQVEWDVLALQRFAKGTLSKQSALTEVILNEYRKLVNAT